AIECGGCCAEYGSKKFIEAVASAKRAWDSDPAADNRENRENNQRHQHDRRRFVNAAVTVSMRRGCGARSLVVSAQMCSVPCVLFVSVLSSSCASIFAAESHIHQPEHIERREKCGH